MSNSIFVDGPAVLAIGPANCTASAYVAPNTSGTGATDHILGYTDNGLQVSINTLTHRVNSDDNGGGEGNPAEMLLVGAIGNIRGTLVKYADPAAWATLITGINGGTDGVFPMPGTALFASGYGFACWAIGTYKTFYFPKCELASSPREFNISTTERRTSFGITAYPTKYLDSTVCKMGLYFVGNGIPTMLCDGCSPVNDYDGDGTSYE